MTEDERLIDGFKQGSREALRQIYDKYKIAMLKFAVVLLGEVNTAEDVVHDVFVSFAQSAQRLKLKGSLKSYLSTSVVNRARNHQRNRRHRGETGLDGADGLVAPSRGPAQWAILDEQLTRLSQTLRGLPYEQREVICCHMELDMTFGEIAELQRASLNTIKGRYRYGMERLRSLLNNEVTR